MNLFWHTKENNKHLLLIFNGWGCDENIISGLTVPLSLDLLLVYDYTHIEQDKLSCTKEYENVTVVAWSLGVYVANQYMEEIANISKTIAVNGTLYPISDDKGIPVNVFEGTIDNYSEQAQKKFFSRVMGGMRNYIDKSRYLSDRSADNQLEELKSLRELIRTSEAVVNEWNTIIISDNDRIYPSDNMKRAWEGKNIHSLHGDHFIEFQHIIDNYL